MKVLYFVVVLTKGHSTASHNQVLSQTIDQLSLITLFVKMKLELVLYAPGVVKNYQI